MFIADTHVHIYKEHELGIFFKSAFHNFNILKRAAEEIGILRPLNIICLTERSDCRFYEELKSGSLQLPQPFELRAAGEDDHIEVLTPSGDSIYVVPGRQIITAEGLEVLGLGLVNAVEDGLELAHAIMKVNSSDACAVVPWSAGKWLGKRGEAVKAAISRPELHFHIGDIPLRPSNTSPPKLFDLAFENSRHLLAGTDPLPLRGEEKLVGTYAAAYKSEISPQNLRASLVRVLKSNESQPATLGSRGTILTAASRLLKLKAKKLSRN